MDGTPPRPSYALPNYDDDHDHITHGSGGNPAAVRLLTSMEEPLPESRPYVPPTVTDAPMSPTLVPLPLAPKKEAKVKKRVRISTPEHLDELRKQEEAHAPTAPPGGE